MCSCHPPDRRVHRSTCDKPVRLRSSKHQLSRPMRSGFSMHACSSTDTHFPESYPVNQKRLAHPQLRLRPPPAGGQPPSQHRWRRRPESVHLFPSAGDDEERPLTVPHRTQSMLAAVGWTWWLIGVFGSCDCFWDWDVIFRQPCSGLAHGDGTNKRMLDSSLD